MKVVFHKDFYSNYTSDPAAAPGRMEAVVDVISEDAEFIEAQPATAEQVAAVHSPGHIQEVTALGLYGISALAAGGAVQSARIGSMSLVSDLFGRRGIMPPPLPVGDSAILTTWRSH